MKEKQSRLLFIFLIQKLSLLGRQVTESKSSWLQFLSKMVEEISCQMNKITSIRILLLFKTVKETVVCSFAIMKKRDNASFKKYTINS